ncbi:MAG: ATP synthase F1 subunit epsilon [Paracoccaceae bacterium]
MSNTIKYELVCPESKVESGEAESVLVPGHEGDFTVLVNHASYLSTLRPGMLKIFSSGNEIEYFVDSGFAEVSDQGLVVLAEKAIKKSDLDKGTINIMISELEEKMEKNEGNDKDKILKQLSDFKNLI